MTENQQIKMNRSFSINGWTLFFLVCHMLTITWLGAESILRSGYINNVGMIQEMLFRWEKQMDAVNHENVAFQHELIETRKSMNQLMEQNIRWWYEMDEKWAAAMKPMWLLPAE